MTTNTILELCLSYISNKKICVSYYLEASTTKAMTSTNGLMTGFGAVSFIESLFVKKEF